MGPDEIKAWTHPAGWEGYPPGLGCGKKVDCAAFPLENSGAVCELPSADQMGIQKADFCAG